MSKQALLIFSKNTEAGKVKTRLAATIGNHAALAIYQQLMLHTFSVTEHLPVDKFVFYSDYIAQDDVWNTQIYKKELQHGADLGERMINAFSFTFQKGYDRIIIVGTDCPYLTSEIVMNAFHYLNMSDIVIGPAEDGGYYLLGMKEPNTDLFKNIQWSTSTVLNETLRICEKFRMTYRLLPVLNDIDIENDLRLFQFSHPTKR